MWSTARKRAASRAGRRAVSDMGRVDILVNALGYNVKAPATEFPMDEWDKLFSVNIRGVMMCCKHFGAQMVEQGGGKIINLSSIRGQRGATGGNIAYCASKGAVNMLTKQLACELAPKNVLVNAIAPIITMTPMTAERIKNEAARYERMLLNVPMGRMAAVDDSWGRQSFSPRRPRISSPAPSSIRTAGCRFCLRSERTMNEAVIVSAVRTAVGRIGGSLKDVQPEDLTKVVIQAAISRAGVDAASIDEVIFGQAKQSADAANLARVAALKAGVPIEVPAYTVMRQCGSGLQAVHNAVQAIRQAGRDHRGRRGGEHEQRTLLLERCAVWYGGQRGPCGSQYRESAAVAALRGVWRLDHGSHRGESGRQVRHLPPGAGRVRPRARRRRCGLSRRTVRG